MLSLERCKKILNNGKRKYTDEEVKQIRDYLYMIAELQFENEAETEIKN
jgi:hypothetical protein